MTLEQLKSEIKLAFQFFKYDKMNEVYEKDGNNTNYIIVFHQLTNENSIIIHTKFIFPLDNKKENTIDNSFLYLYDINCVYKKVKFEKLKDSIDYIFTNDKFGKKLLSLSNFLITPEINLNSELYKEKITDFSIFLITYNVKQAIFPCQNTEFNFTINIQDRHNIYLNIKKTKDEVIYTFTLDDKPTTYKDTDLESIYGTIVGYIKEMKNILSN
jgi:hypothetical protein